MAAKKLFTQIFIYFSKPLRLLYSLIIYEIVNFSFFTLYSLLLLSFFLYLKSVPIYVIVHANHSARYICTQIRMRRGCKDKNPYTVPVQYVVHGVYTLCHSGVL